jgi:sigma-B regulation protein RsbU (phosphoserine phosphatase)
MDGEIKYYGTEDIPVGIYPEYHFSEKTIEISHGDLFIVYSDGIIEAENVQEEPFGEPRLAEILKTHRQLQPEQLLEKVFIGVNDFAQDMPQLDDQTLLIVKLDHP